MGKQQTLEKYWKIKTRQRKQQTLPSYWRTGRLQPTQGPTRVIHEVVEDRVAVMPFSGNNIVFLPSVQGLVWKTSARKSAQGQEESISLS